MDGGLNGPRQQPRSILRRLTSENAATLLNLINANRQNLGQFLPTPDFLSSVEEVEQVLTNESMDVEGIYEGPKLLGAIILAKVADCTAQIGYFIDRSHSGQGLASESLSRAVQDAPYDSFIAYVDPSNIVSVRVLEKSGFFALPSRAENGDLIYLFEHSRQS